MKKQHATFVLLTLFFAGLAVLWWADYADLPTEQERRERSGLVLPGLRTVAASAIRRIEITPGPGAGRPKVVLERRGEGWQIVAPIDAAADPTLAETLAQNLKGLRKSAEAGTILEAASKFGLDPPSATLRAFGSDAATPLATLEIGKSIRDRVYVRSPDGAGIEVVDSRLLKASEGDVVDWRDKAIFNVPTFQVSAMKVSGPGRDLKVERIDGHWTITEPLRAPADDLKVEDIVAEITSLRVHTPGVGFVASDVRDLGPYGLDPKSAVNVELIPVSTRGEPQVLRVGKPAPDQPDKRFAVRSDQDDVVLVDGKVFNDLGSDRNALRSKKVATLDPARVDFIRIRTSGTTLALSRGADGWGLVGSTRTRADDRAVPGLLARFADLQASEFLKPGRIGSPGLDPPAITIDIWEARRGQKPAATAPDEPSGPPALHLDLGRHDLLKKTVYARVAGDPTILALPDEILKALPANEFAFRDRAVAELHPARVERLTITREGRSFTLVPGSSREPNSWRLETPIDARADEEAVTKALTTLSQLHAERLVASLPADERAYGLADPAIKVGWSELAAAGPGGESSGTVVRTLRIGATEPGRESRYASVTGSPYIFTLGNAAVLPFLEEFRNRRVLTFTTPKVTRLALRWPRRTLAYAHHPTPGRAPTDWDPEPGTDPAALALSRIDALANDLSRLMTRKFVQYNGPIPASTGLAEPPLTVEVHLTDPPRAYGLRVGAASAAGEYFATTATGSDGAVFLLSGTGWGELLKASESDELPADVFAPAPR